MNGEGFIRFSDDTNNDELYDIVTKLMSVLTEPTFDQINQAINENKKCYFTDKGLSKYHDLIHLYIEKLNELGFQVNKLHKTTDDVIYIDDYQVFA